MSSKRRSISWSPRTPTSAALRDLIEELDDLIEDDDFRGYQARALVIYATPKDLRSFRVPNALKAQIVDWLALYRTLNRDPGIERVGRLLSGSILRRRLDSAVPSRQPARRRGPRRDVRRQRRQETMRCR